MRSSCEHVLRTVLHGENLILIEDHILQILAFSAVNFRVPKD
jgi:hypothetical protein